MLLTSLYRPALAEYASYQGQVQIQPDRSVVCSALSADTTLNIEVFGRDDAPGQRIDAYLIGEKLVAAHVSGTNIGRLSVTFPGESSPSHTLQLRNTGPGAFVGELQVKTMMAALSGCGFSKATIQFSNVGLHTQSAYDQAAMLFQLDSRAVTAYVQGLKGKVKDALPVLQEGLNANSKVYGAAHGRLLPYYFLSAQLHHVEGSYPEEIPLYRKALTVCEQAYGAETPCSALTLTGLSESLNSAGDYPEAEATARRAVAIGDKVFGPSAPLSGISLNALGAVLIYTGRYAEAESTLDRALVLNKQAYGTENAYVAIALINQGVVYRYTGQFARAEAVMRQALAIDNKVLGAENPLTLLNTIILGQILRLSGRPHDAEPLCRQALTTAQKVLGPDRPDHPALGAGLICLAEVLRETGRYAEAEPLYRQALANNLKYFGADNPDVGTTSLMLARLLRTTGRDAEALTLLKNAYRIAHVTGNQIIGWRVPDELMRVYGAGAAVKPAVAIFYGKEAVNNLQRLRGNLGETGSAAQQAFIGAVEVSSVYRTLADLLIADGRLAEAQQVLAMLKEQEFYDYTRSTSGADPRKTTASLSAPEKELDDLNGKDIAFGKELGVLQEKLHKTGQLTAAERDRLKTLHKLMDTAQDNFDARVLAVARSSDNPQAQKLRRQEITDLSRSFQGTLKDMGHDAVIAQYFILDDKVQILLTTPDAEVAREAPVKRADLNAQIHAYRQTLSSPNANPLPQAQALYRLLIGPIAEDLRQAGAKTLMLSLDDTLRYLPFAALHDGEGYLIERFSVVMVNEAVRDKLGKLPEQQWKVLALGVTKAHDDAVALPWVDVELNGIAGPKGILAGQVMLDGAFNEESLRTGLDQAFPIVHIASHFRFAPGSMDDSVLLLGDGSRMTLAQINTKLNFKNVDLLTLSACETAVGDDSAADHGIEVEGLGAIAQQAGAKAVLASLWSVSDNSTALLMRTLYKSHKEDHVTKAESLRHAQLALLHGSVQADPSIKNSRGLTRVAASSAPATFKIDAGAPFAHPYFWAPFILMGNWL